MLAFGAARWVGSVFLVPLAVRIHAIQGSAHVSPWQGRAVSAVVGVVTAVGPSSFYIQDDQPDDDDATSEGVRVQSSAHVNTGDRVSVDGVVVESRFGCNACGPRDRAYENLATTAIAASAVVVLAHGEALPTAIPWVPARASALPPDPDSAEPLIDLEAAGAVLAPRTSRIDRDESLEGMRVLIDEPSVAGPLALVQGARELALQAPEDAEAVMVSGALGVALPEASRGDHVAGQVTGVLDYRAGRYVLLATAPLPKLTAARPAPLPPLGAPEQDELSVGTINLQNFSAVSAASKRDALAAAIALDMRAPDVVVLEEVQDDSGARDDGITSAELTSTALRSAIEVLGGPPYSYRDVPPEDGSDGGEPGGNIRVGIMVRADRPLRVVERSSAPPLPAEPAPDRPLRLRESPARVAPSAAAFIDSRKPLAIELRWGEQPVFIVGCHFVSQLADAARYGRFQPPPRPSQLTRRAQADAVAELVSSLLLRDPQASVIVAGDLNDENGSPVLSRLRASGLRDVLDDASADERLTHVYDGRGEALDHLLVSASLAPTLIAAHVVHGFAGQVRAPTDHDPVVARFRLAAPDSAPGASGGCAFANPRAHSAWKSWMVIVAGWALGRVARRRGGACEWLSASGNSGMNCAP